MNNGISTNIRLIRQRNILYVTTRMFQNPVIKAMTIAADSAT